MTINEIVQMFREQIQKATEVKTARNLEELGKGMLAHGKALLNAAENQEEKDYLRVCQLAAISTAAFGYYKEPCADEFKTTALNDVLKLYDKFQQLTEENAAYREALEFYAADFRWKESCYDGFESDFKDEIIDANKHGYSIASEVLARFKRGE